MDPVGALSFFLWLALMGGGKRQGPSRGGDVPPPPPPPPPPPGPRGGGVTPTEPSCPPGQTWSFVNNACVDVASLNPDVGPGDCPDGYMYSPSQHKCVPGDEPKNGVTPWPSASPANLPSFPSGWRAMHESELTPAVVERALWWNGQLWDFPTRTKRKDFAQENLGGRWVTFYAQMHGDKMGTEAWVPKDGSPAPGPAPGPVASQDHDMGAGAPGPWSNLPQQPHTASAATYARGFRAGR